MYPIGMVWDESRLVVRRKNSDEVTRATLLNLAVSSVLSEKAGKQFREIIDRLNEE